MKPAMVFIVDVRRANLHLPLKDRALFQKSAERGDFVFRLFFRKAAGRVSPTWFNGA